MQNELNKVLKWLLLPILMVSLFLLILSINALKEFSYIGRDFYPNKTISVTGTGEVFATADIAEFSFTVTKKASSVGDAQGQVDGVINSVLESIKDFGIEDKDIKTSAYNAYPIYVYPEIACISGYCPPRGEGYISGYEVSQTISIKVRDTSKAGDAISSVGEAGVSNISGLRFVVDDEDTLQREARDKAIADAQNEIENLSKELGVKVKGIVSFSESNYNPKGMYLESAAYGLGGDSVSLPQGENQISVQVYITYEIR
ncbi:MAG: SIMPL domain-containing protein [Candidatus Pacebacteria bacterium]|nr:SIMPL domain-containing protein [Candidatus Paceibacterota bacterium]